MTSEARSVTQGSTTARVVGALCLTALIVVPVVEAFRGLDMTDTGWMLTNQRFIFSHPGAVTYWFHLWLCNVLGGVVDLAFGTYGVLPHKLAATLIYWATVGSVFYLYRRSTTRWQILVATTVSLVFNFVNKSNVVQYNNVSSLLYLLSAAFLAEAVLGQRARWYVYSGIAAGLNVFVRLPNVVGILIIFLPYLLLIPVFRGDAEPVKVKLRDVVLFLVGVLGAVVAAISTMAILGDLPYYSQSIGSLVNTQSVDSGGYGLSTVIRRPLRDAGFAILSAVPALGVLAATSGFVALFRNRLLRMLSGIFVAGAVLVLFSAIHPNLHWVFIVSSGVCYSAVILILLDRHSGLAIKLTAGLSAAITLMMSIGSDTAIVSATYLFPAMFPALLYAANALRRLTPGIQPLRRLVSPVGFAVCMCFVGLSAYEIPHGVYRDTNAMRWTADYPQIARIFTNRARAQELDHALPVISQFAPAGSTLFAYDSLPLVNYATRTLPYIGNSWPAQYAPAYLDKRLKLAEKTERLPVVLMAKSNPRSDQWPLDNKPITNAGPVVAYLERNHYKLVWEDTAFSLFVPPGWKK